MAAATAAAAAIGSASDTSEIPREILPTTVALRELTQPSAQPGGAPAPPSSQPVASHMSAALTADAGAVDEASYGADTAGDATTSAAGGQAAAAGSKPCKKRASLQRTATALAAATAAQTTLLDASQPLPHGVTEEDQANAKVRTRPNARAAHEKKRAPSAY